MILRNERLGLSNHETKTRDSKFDKENVVDSKSNRLLPDEKQQVASRKPFGNIANGSTKQVDLVAKKGQQPARRAFGDITNKEPKPGVRHAEQQNSSKVQAHAAANREMLAADKTRPTSAAPEIELRAGKGWQQLETDRALDEDRKIRQRVQTISTSIQFHAPPHAQV
jgi:hypothetical protein